MKTIITIGFFVAVSFFSELTMAGGNFRVNVALKSESNALREISNNSEQKYEISITNLDGDLIYHREDQLDKLESRKVFDFSKSEYGVYNLKVKLDGESSEQLVTVTRDGVQVGEIVRKADPVFNLTGNLLVLSSLNQSKEGMSLGIYSDEKLVWEQALKNSSASIRKFDLSKLEPGDYRVVLSVGNDDYEYELTK
jgi:hypothetical protein